MIMRQRSTIFSPLNNTEKHLNCKGIEIKIMKLQVKINKWGSKFFFFSLDSRQTALKDFGEKVKIILKL